MGRPKLSDADKDKITIQLIQVAQRIVLRDGLENVTIRKIASEANLNSATLYKCFQDLDTLLLFACIDAFQAYIIELELRKDELSQLPPQDAYIQIWSIFCTHTLKAPECSKHLFFSKHSDKLDSVIKQYFSLFPERFETMPVSLMPMIKAAQLQKRNMELLQATVASGFSQNQLTIINELTIAYYRSIIEQKLNPQNIYTDKQLIDRMLKVCELLFLIPEQEKEV